MTSNEFRALLDKALEALPDDPSPIRKLCFELFQTARIARESMQLLQAEIKKLKQDNAQLVCRVNELKNHESGLHQQVVADVATKIRLEAEVNRLKEIADQEFVIPYAELQKGVVEILRLSPHELRCRVYGLKDALRQAIADSLGINPYGRSKLTSSAIQYFLHGGFSPYQLACFLVDKPNKAYLFRPQGPASNIEP